MIGNRCATRFRRTGILQNALAGVLELDYRMVSNTIAERHVGSNPTSRTIQH